MRKWLMLDGKWLSAYGRTQPPRGKFEFRAVVPRPLATPGLVPDKPWEAGGLGWHTLHHDSGRYRLWYEARDRGSQRVRLCYAESEDLLSWHKAQNNIVLEDAWGRVVCLDPRAPPEQRARFIVPIPWQPGDSQPVAFWDQSLGQFVGYFGRWEMGCRVNPAAKLRCIARAETHDLHSLGSLPRSLGRRTRSHAVLVPVADGPATIATEPADEPRRGSSRRADGREWRALEL